MIQVFSEKWFDHHQDRFLDLLNKRITRRLARWVFSIRRHDCPLDAEIIAIRPTNFCRRGSGSSVITDFRSNDKFARSLFHKLHPVWRSAHAWDMMVANRMAPALNLGFDTTPPIYPSFPVTNTCDGDIVCTGTGMSWAQLQGGTAGSFSASTSPSGSATLIAIAASADVYAPDYGDLGRSIFLFDTSIIGAGATVTASTLSIFGQSKARTDVAWSMLLNAYSSNPTSNTVLSGVDNTDYNSLGSTPFCDSPISYAAFNTAAYNDLILNASGLAAINVSGITKLGARDALYDVPNSDPLMGIGQAVIMFSYFSGQTGTANDPKLVVTYTPASVTTGSAFLLNMLRK